MKKIFHSLYNKLFHNFKIRRCRLNYHIKGCHTIISKIPTGEWEPPRAGNDLFIQAVSLKIKCSHCNCIFLKETWDYKHAKDYFNDI